MLSEECLAERLNLRSDLAEVTERLWVGHKVLQVILYGSRFPSILIKQQYGGEWVLYLSCKVVLDGVQLVNLQVFVGISGLEFEEVGCCCLASRAVARVLQNQVVVTILQNFLTKILGI